MDHHRVTCNFNPILFFILTHKFWFGVTPILLDFLFPPIAVILSHFLGQYYIWLSFYGDFCLSESIFYLRKNCRDNFFAKNRYFEMAIESFFLKG